MFSIGRWNAWIGCCRLNRTHMHTQMKNTMIITQIPMVRRAYECISCADSNWVLMTLCASRRCLTVDKNWASVIVSIDESFCSIWLILIRLLLSFSKSRRGTARVSHFVSWTHGASEVMMLIGVWIMCCFSSKEQPLGIVMVDDSEIRAEMTEPLLHFPLPV